MSRYVLVTGGAQGLGRAICSALAKEKHNLVIHYRHSLQEAETLQKQLSQYPIQVETIFGDFSTIESTRTFLEEYQNRFAETKGLINNVGNYSLGHPLSISPEEMRDLFQINVTSALMCAQALTLSLKRSQGHIINIGMAGSDHVLANTHASLYNMTKTALSMLTKSLAKELAPFQVCVNMVSPGYLENSIDLPKQISDIPWGRAGQLKEVAELICFLISDQQRYITGQNIAIAGGVRI